MRERDEMDGVLGPRVLLIFGPIIEYPQKIPLIDQNNTSSIFKISISNNHFNHIKIKIITNDINSE